MSATKTSALDQLLLDLFITAMEGGIGYWSQCLNYHWINPDNEDEADYAGFFADIIEPDEVGENVPYPLDFTQEGVHHIDRKVIAKGYRLATTEWRERFFWSSGERPPLVVGPDTDWDFDATDADAIVQLGLWGEVIYG